MVVDAIRVPDEPVAISTAWGVVRLLPEDVAASVEEVLARGVTHATGKEAVRNQLAAPRLRAARAGGRGAGAQGQLRGGGPLATPGSVATSTACWPTMRRQHGGAAPAHQPGRAAGERAPGSSTADEADLLARPLPSRKADVRWWPADVALLDEAEARLHGVRTTYGHIIVDEAQDLSAMALRMLARRAHGRAR